MRDAEPVGAAVGALELEILHEAEHDVEIARLGVDPLATRRAHCEPFAKPDREGAPNPAQEPQQPAPGPGRIPPGSAHSTLEAPARNAQYVIVDDRRAEGGAGDVAEHPRVPAAESPRGAETAAHIGIVHLLV